MYLKQEKLSIRAAATQDAAMLCQWWNDGKVMDHAGFPHGIGTNVEKVAASIKDDNELSRRLILDYDKTPIGEMNYRTTTAGVAEIGIKICDFDYQNQGYGTTYLSMLINYLFKKKSYAKIILDTNMKNKRAQHVYEKLGFKKTRTIIDKWKNQVGELQSAIEYELTADSFLAEQRKASSIADDE